MSEREEEHPYIDRSQSCEIGKLAKALVKAQSEMKHAKLDGLNPHFKSKFATLHSVIDAVKGLLIQNGIAVVQMPFTIGEHIGIKTKLIHESGEWICSELHGDPGKAGPQAMGSCITYFRRYALSAMCGIAADEDDDGETAGNTSRPARPKAQQKPKASAIEEARATFKRILDEEKLSGYMEKEEIEGTGEYSEFELFQYLDTLRLRARGQ